MTRTQSYDESKAQENVRIMDFLFLPSLEVYPFFPSDKLPASKMLLSNILFFGAISGVLANPMPKKKKSDVGFFDIRGFSFGCATSCTWSFDVRITKTRKYHRWMTRSIRCGGDLDLHQDWRDCGLISKSHNMRVYIVKETNELRLEYSFRDISFNIHRPETKKIVLFQGSKIVHPTWPRPKGQDGRINFKISKSYTGTCCDGLPPDFKQEKGRKPKDEEALIQSLAKTLLIKAKLKPTGNHVQDIKKDIGGSIASTPIEIVGMIPLETATKMPGQTRVILSVPTSTQTTAQREVDNPAHTSAQTPVRVSIQSPTQTQIKTSLWTGEMTPAQTPTKTLTQTSTPIQSQIQASEIPYSNLEDSK